MTVFIQILLTAVILTLTILVAFAAIQVFHILHEFRLVLKQLNVILQNTQTISKSSSKPITAVNNFFSEVKTLVDKTQDEIIDSTPDHVIKPTTKPHFFHRSGLPLRPS